MREREKQKIASIHGSSGIPLVFFHLGLLDDDGPRILLRVPFMQSKFQVSIEAVPITWGDL